MLDCVADVPCGAYEKVAVALRRLPVETRTQFCWIDAGDGRARGELSGRAGRGADADRPCRRPTMRATWRAEGEAAMVALATERLAEAFGSAIRGEILGTAVTGVAGEPLRAGGLQLHPPRSIGAAARDDRGRHGRYRLCGRGVLAQLVRDRAWRLPDRGGMWPRALPSRLGRRLIPDGGGMVSRRS